MNKPVGTRGNLHFKTVPGSQGFGMNTGQFQMNQGQFSKYSSKVTRMWKSNETKKLTFFEIFLMKTSKITLKGKFTTNVRIAVIYFSLYLCDVSLTGPF